MIPFFELPTFHAGPLTIAPFGIFVGLGVYLASVILVAEAKRDGRSTRVLADYAFWGFVGGLVGGHLMHVLLYHPEELQKSAFQIFKIWDGLSSTGGLLGGVVTAMIFFRVRHASFWDYGDAFGLAVPTGWAIARVGCFVSHDHPGKLTSFPLAVNFAAGARHDLGLYDALWLTGIALLVWFLARRKLLVGRHLALAGMLYAVGRIFFDTLRATDLPYVDARYFGLTPAQYFCIALFLFGAYRFWKPVPRNAPVKLPATKPLTP